MNDLEKILPHKVVERARYSGSELIFQVDDAKDAIRLATDAGIAILGVEIFRISEAGLKTENYTDYNYEFNGDWQQFVNGSNQAATQYINEHKVEEDYGYILTTASIHKFKQMKEHAR